MEVKRNGYPYTLEGYGEVVLAELTSQEMLMCYRQVSEEVLEAASMAVAESALKLSLRKIKGKEVKYSDLINLHKFFRTSQMVELIAVMNQIHNPLEEEYEKAKIESVMTIEDDKDIAIITVSYQDFVDPNIWHKQGTFKMLCNESLGAMQQGARAVASEKKPLARLFLKRLHNLRRAIVSMDNKPFDANVEEWPLSMKMTTLLGDLHDHFHGMDKQMGKLNLKPGGL